jgi:hypothetical protein|tara:strand:+ start:323 stop:628 length:306 start_codon:yes stop_codon:yes gene_type:complete
VVALEVYLLEHVNLDQVALEDLVVEHNNFHLDADVQQEQVMQVVLVHLKEIMVVKVYPLVELEVAEESVVLVLMVLEAQAVTVDQEQIFLQVFQDYLIQEH